MPSQRDGNVAELRTRCLRGSKIGEHGESRSLPRINHQQGTLGDEQPASRLPSIFDDGDAYDRVLGGKDITYGLDFYVGLARAANGPVLDVACGTGRILLPCLQAGVDEE
jgi:hypothetical protein